MLTVHSYLFLNNLKYAFQNLTCITTPNVYFLGYYNLQDNMTHFFNYSICLLLLVRVKYKEVVYETINCKQAPKILSDCQLLL